MGQICHNQSWKHSYYTSFTFIISLNSTQKGTWYIHQKNTNKVHFIHITEVRKIKCEEEEKDGNEIQKNSHDNVQQQS